MAAIQWSKTCQIMVSVKEVHVWKTVVQLATHEFTTAAALLIKIDEA
jgi:hypothetical protein